MTTIAPCKARNPANLCRRISRHERHDHAITFLSQSLANELAPSVGLEPTGASLRTLVGSRQNITTMIKLSPLIHHTPQVPFNDNRFIIFINGNVPAYNPEHRHTLMRLQCKGHCFFV